MDTTPERAPADPDPDPDEGMDRMERVWRSSGLATFSLSAAIALAVYVVINWMSGSRLAAIGIATGIPVMYWGWRLSQRRPYPRWAALPIISFLICLFAILLLVEHENSAVMMFLPAGPALAIFGLGSRAGLWASVVMLVMMILTLAFNDHLLNFAYASRMTVAYLFTAGIAFTYERNRELAVRELRRARSRIRNLEELLPVCAWCRRIRNEDGSWSGVEDYLARSNSVELTHGVCPSCAHHLEDFGDPSV